MWTQRVLLAFPAGPVNGHPFASTSWTIEIVSTVTTATSPNTKIMAIKAKVVVENSILLNMKLDFINARLLIIDYLLDTGGPMNLEVAHQDGKFLVRVVSVDYFPQ